MEAFSLLKFWRIADVAGVSDTDVTMGYSSETIEEEDSFFDLEFSVPGYQYKEQQNDAVDVQINASDSSEKDHNSKPQSPISFLRSPPKFRVFMLFKKPKTEKSTAKCKVEEEQVPIFSLLARVNSSKKDNASSKRLVQKYLKLIKPLSFRASKRYTEKSKFSDAFSTASPSSSPAMGPVRSPRKQAEEKQGCRQPSLLVVCKHLGKSRSASSAVGIMPPPPAASRRDDSLVQQHDGIQSAILHCKRSYNSSREFSGLSRPANDPGVTSVNPYPPRTSTEEVKTRTSI